MNRGVWRLPPEWLVFSVIVVDLIGFGIVIPILPFMSPALGGDEMDVALVIAVYSLGAGVMGPFWGGLSDRIGRKRVLMICLFGGAVSSGMLGVATELWMQRKTKSSTSSCLLPVPTTTRKPTPASFSARNCAQASSTTK